MSKPLSTEEKLRERTKELTCLYEISSLLEQQHPEEELLLRVCGLLKQAWRFTEKAVVELKTEQHHLCTAEVPLHSVFQESPVPGEERELGYIKVHYPAEQASGGNLRKEEYEGGASASSGAFRKEQPDVSAALFLPEEQQLLDRVAADVGSFLEKEKHRKQEELLQRKAERNDRLSILGEITAGIAHELNTPLGNILGFAELISQRTTDPQIKQDTQKIVRASIFSREVVKKLMFFSCEMPQNMEFIKVEPVISQALALLGQNFKKAQVSYNFDSEAPELEAQLDSIQLTQVIFNILINAIYVAPEGSSVDIKLYQQDPDSFFIEIADEGPGIAPEVRPKIFEPFFTTKPVGVGSGLGLSVVHGIIRSHRGSIESFDNEPQGTVFKIHLPIKL